MAAALNPPDVQRILAPLKDFQRRTVDYVFRRLYEDPDRVDRFLIADEVGLGKTLVARGVVARAVERLWPTVDRIDVIYICANRDIARQNVSRLNITGELDVASATRMTLLPLTLRNLQGRRLNFVAFTPRTSFDLRSQGGIRGERALIYHILRRAWGFGDRAGPKNLLQCGVGRQRWLKALGEFDVRKIDAGLAREYVEALNSGYPHVCQEFERLQGAFGHYRKHIPREDHKARLELIGQLRRVLAESCLRALEPDIVILDEFQRFKYLLQGDDEVALLAQALFRYPKVKTLLLSATPYKMYTMYHEQSQEDHYADFTNTVEFLVDSQEETKALSADLREFRAALLRAAQGADGIERLGKARDCIQARLRRVMVRSERPAATREQDAMVDTTEDQLDLTTAELAAFGHLDRVAAVLDAPDTVEYWKSTPYVLNLMDKTGYKLKESLVDAIAQGGDLETLKTALAGPGEGLLSWEDIQAYKELDAGNARMRVLLNHAIDSGAWRLLWIAPSLPYYRAGSGPYADPQVCNLTKALVFSAWRVVPKAISTLCSYEAERRMVAGFDPEADYESERRKRSPLLRFALARQRTGPARFTGMSNFNLLYPCWTLASRLDPLQLGAQLATDGDGPELESLLEHARREVADLIRPITRQHGTPSGRVDDRWYWAAMAHLDRRHARQQTGIWLGHESEQWAWREMLQSRKGDEDDSNFASHVDVFGEYYKGEHSLGRPPDNLEEVLAKAALASPAIVSLRALMRMVPPRERDSHASALLWAAARVSLGFRSLFNSPDSITLVRSEWSGDDERYWESVLDYCLKGNLQSVIDEYAHMLRESLGVFSREPATAVNALALEMSRALSIRTASLAFDDIRVGRFSGGQKPSSHSIRCLFSLAFQSGVEESGRPIRSEQVRTAFNSPFRPFVLATTSIGQEGLDFHHYCHAVYHWNLPSNPVDLEQREGRVHRYKGHAIRRNLAAAHSLGALRGRVANLQDPWPILFSLAAQEREPGANDLVPYWIYEPNGGRKVERHILAYPLSRESERIPQLLASLAAYRMVFGQPRQQDLLRYLQEQACEDVDLQRLLQYRVDLSPP